MHDSTCYQVCEHVFDFAILYYLLWIKFMNNVIWICFFFLVLRLCVLLVNFVHHCSAQRQNLANMLAWYLFSLYLHQNHGMKSSNLHGQMATESMFFCYFSTSED
jgi:hypothetical protein